jgi:hypothetical protein
MASILHGSVRTTPRVRAELQASKEKTSILARRYGLSRTTVTKWRSRSGTADAPMGPRDPCSTVLTPVEEAMIVAFRQRTLLPLDDVMGCLREIIPKLTRSSLHRCLQRHGISRLPANETMAKRGRFADQKGWVASCRHKIGRGKAAPTIVRGRIGLPQAVRSSSMRPADCTCPAPGGQRPSKP